MDKKAQLQPIRNRRRKRTHRSVCVRFLLAAMATSLLLMGAAQNLTTLPAESFPAETTVPVREITSAPETKAPVESPLPTDDWKLTLVNPRTTLPDSYEIELTKLKNGHSVDERCYPALQEMMDACRAEGLHPVICSSYRTQEKQEQLFQRQVDKLTARGRSEAEARIEAGKVVAVPGTSEHQLGLAVDIVDFANQNLNEGQEDTAVQKWMMENSWRFGFILRYPNNKSAITGIIYEPWHYRYVGVDTARKIYEQGICLEEYLEQQTPGSTGKS